MVFCAVTTSRVHGEAGIHELRRRQATAIVLLGVIGAEFGGFDARQGDELARQTAFALSQLLLLPGTSVLPLFSPLRRAGIDLLGRGFVVWQPFVDLNRVLCALLEQCAGSANDPATGLPLNPDAETRRSAHKTLGMIATARPSAVIIALAMEVARYNSSAQTLQHATSSPLLKARAEVIKLIELLAEKQSNELMDLMIPVSVSANGHLIIAHSDVRHCRALP
jgi:hypothetical protein